VAVCPFGAISYNAMDGKIIKCDLCGGEPQCVRFCDVKALTYVEADRLSDNRKRDAAKKVYTAQKEVIAI